MPNDLSSRDVDVKFIRLLFTDPVQEEVAYRWASRFARVIGKHALKLRPGTTLAEMLKWAAAAKVDTIDFVVVFEPELRIDFAEFLDHSEHTTFREMVEHYAKRFSS
jgi:hypothetical protein